MRTRGPSQIPSNHAKQHADFTDEDVQNEIWKRRKGEPRIGYVAFQVYLNMETARSLRRIRDLMPSPLPHFDSIAGWSTRYEWIKRACAYDAHMDAIAQQERERLRREREALWEERREQIRDDEFKAAEKLRARVMEMLEVPLFEEREEVQEGEECIIRVRTPAGWRLRDAARFADTFSKLARLSADMATEKAEIEFDVKNASDEELDKIIGAKG